jgi:transposase InsO family protein
MLGELDGNRPYSARTGLNEDHLARFNLGNLNERLPCRQCHQRDGRCLHHVEVLGPRRYVGFIDSNEFGECADCMIAWPRIDRITHLELPDLGSSPDYGSGDIVPQDERWTIRKKEFELSIPDFGVQWVHGRGLNPNQDIAVSQLRFWHVDQTQRTRLFVLIDDECLHWLSPI